jgi:7-carboxy-7-deazaguanine synthase
MAQFEAGTAAVAGAHLPVVETFHSLQGEGVHAGRSAFFIRLGGCGVGCSWCDTKHSWPEEVHPRQQLNALGAVAALAVSRGAGFIVITGGEPLHHNLTDLCGVLRQEVAHACGGTTPLHLETSGVDPLSGSFDWITLSPKRHKPPTPQLLAACHELKVVVHDAGDLVFAAAMAEAATTCRSGAARARGPALLLQPGHACMEGQQLAIAFVQQHPQWRLSLQTHKLLGVR